MNPQDYAYAVAVVRALSGQQLTEQAMDRLWAAPDETSRQRILAEAGWEIDRDVETMCRARLIGVWRTLQRIAPQPDALAFLVMTHEFDNLAACLLCQALQRSADALYRAPALTPPAQMHQAVKEKRWNSLPEYLQEPARRAWDQLSSTMEGDAVAGFLQGQALRATRQSAEKNGDALLIRLAEQMVRSRMFKVSRYAAANRWQPERLLARLSMKEEKDAIRWADAAARGLQALADVWRTQGFTNAAEQMESQSAATFEAWCDDQVLLTAEQARMEPFGPGALAAYYLQAQAETVDVRLAYAQGAAEDTAQRRRRLYA